VSTGGVTLSGSTGNPAANATAVFTDSKGNSTTFTFVTSGTSGAGTTTVGTAGTDGTLYNGAKNVQVLIGANSAASEGNLLSAMQANGLAASMSNSGAITVNGGGITAADVTAAAANGVSTGAAAALTVSVVASATTVGTVTAVPGTGTSAIAAVNAAIVTIGATLSKLGATTLQLQGLSDFTSKLSTSVSTGLGAIVDANLSEESAKLSSLQTKQSLAIQSLSLANQGPGALLQLFR
jgi:flagellin